MNSFTRNMVFLVAAVLALESSASAAKYTTRFDNVDIDEIIKSDRLVANYTNCLLDKGKCTPDADELKRLLPDAMHTNCEYCSDKQRSGARQLIFHLFDKKPDIFDQILKKYDPQGTFAKKYRLRI